MDRFWRNSSAHSVFVIIRWLMEPLLIECGSKTRWFWHERIKMHFLYSVILWLTFILKTWYSRCNIYFWSLFLFYEKLQVLRVTREEVRVVGSTVVVQTIRLTQESQGVLNSPWKKYKRQPRISRLALKSDKVVSEQSIKVYWEMELSLQLNALRRLECDKSNACEPSHYVPSLKSLSLLAGCVW